MEPLFLYLALSLIAVVGLTILALIALKAFRAWIDFKHFELSQAPSPASSSTHRINLADLKERIRKLEAIASGVDM